MNNNKVMLFIVGMPRSGTTLLQSLLNRNKDVLICPETHFFTRGFHQVKSPVEALKKFIDTSEFEHLNIDKDTFIEQFNKQKIEKSVEIFSLAIKLYCGNKNYSVIGEKTPGNFDYLDDILNWNSEAKVLWIIRDPRAISASYQKVPWHRKGDILGPAIRWNSCCNKALKSIKNYTNVLTIKYEDIVNSPDTSLTTIENFLSIPKMPRNLLDESKAIKVNINNDWQKEHIHNAGKPIDCKSLTKWHNELTNRQIKQINRVCYTHMQRLGYTTGIKTSFPQLWSFFEKLKYSVSNPKVLIKALRAKLT